jgi:Protein of unknown function (DUF4238)
MTLAPALPSRRIEENVPVPENKSQHFVPQFYLRNFARRDVNKLICLYHLPTDRFVPRAPIRTQACEDYFYQDPKVEKGLSELEAIARPIITAAVTSEVLPNWRSLEHTQLLIFVLFQSLRTRSAADETNEQQEKMLKQLVEMDPRMTSFAEAMNATSSHTPLMLLRLAAMHYYVAIDLRYKMLRNGTGNPFIPSDHPVVPYNQFYERKHPLQSNTGLGSRGLQLFFPLNPSYILVLYDYDV